MCLSCPIRHFGTSRHIDTTTTCKETQKAHCTVPGCDGTGHHNPTRNYNHTTRCTKQILINMSTYIICVYTVHVIIESRKQSLYCLLQNSNFATLLISDLWWQLNMGTLCLSPDRRTHLDLIQCSQRASIEGIRLSSRSTLSHILAFNVLIHVKCCCDGTSLCVVYD